MVGSVLIALERPCGESFCEAALLLQNRIEMSNENKSTYVAYIITWFPSLLTIVLMSEARSGPNMAFHEIALKLVLIPPIW